MINHTSKHILHIARRRIIPAAEMSYILKNCSNKNRFIGAMPPEIIKSIPAQSRGDITRRTDEIFANFARDVAHVTVSSSVHHSYYNESLKKYFPQIIYGLGNILNRNDISISYIGSGNYKHCFLLSFGEDSSNRYVLQTFQSKVNFDPEYCPHGVLYEPQNCFTIYKKYSHGRVARPFMARPTTTEILSDGYILVKYIDSAHPTKGSLRHFVDQHTQMTNTDFLGKDNTVRGIAVDIGGFIKNPEHIAAPQTRYKLHELTQIFNNIDFANGTSDVCSTLDDIFVKYGNEFFNTTLWPKFLKKIPHDKRDTARRTLKSFRKLKIKSDKMAHDPDWDVISEHIIKDLKYVLTYSYGTAKFHSEIINDILHINQR